MLITNNFNITMAVFDVAQHVINSAVGIIGGATAVDGAALASMQDTHTGRYVDRAADRCLYGSALCREPELEVSKKVGRSCKPSSKGGR